MSRFAALAAFAALGIGAGCATDDPPPLDFHADTGPAEAVEDPDPARIIAQLTTDEGATLTFSNEEPVGAEPIIHVEIMSPASTPSLDAVMAQEPSSLELYMAIAPTQAAPAELVREHQLLAEVDSAYTAEPRRLDVSAPISSVVDENVGCSNYNSWRNSFLAWAPALTGPGSPYTALNSGNSTGYVGYAPRFYFDVCRVTASNPNIAYAADTQRRSNSAAAWALDPGAGAHGILGPGDRYRFFRNSFTCSSFQHRLVVTVFAGGSYNRGAAWSDEWSCSIES